MKNIQVFDGADNSVFDIFAATEEEFDVLFPSGQDVAFIDEICARLTLVELQPVFAAVWKRRILKRDAMGIHGLLFYDPRHKAYYPTRRDEEAINPDGTLLRARKD